MKKYSWNFNEFTEEWFNNTFDTIEECIYNAQEENKLYSIGSTKVYIGTNKPYEYPGINISNVLDDTITNAYDYIGEAAELWEDKISKLWNGEIAKLEEDLNKTINKWINKNLPKLYTIENIKEYELYNH